MAQSFSINDFIKRFIPLGTNNIASRGAVNPPINNRQADYGTTVYTPEEAQKPVSLEYSRNFSHRLFINSAAAKAAGRVLVQGVIGPGLELRSEIRRKTKTNGVYKLNEPANKKIVDAWNEWGRAVSVDGQLSWLEFTRRALHTMIESGDVFVRFYDIVPENPVIRLKPKSKKEQIRLSLQLIEGDSLDTTYTGTINQTEGDYWLDGVKYNKFGRPLAYAFKVMVQGVYQTKEYNASEVLHLYKKDDLRPNSRRGWPWLTPVLSVIDRMQAYFASQLLHAENNAAVTTYLTSDIFGPYTPEQKAAQNQIITNTPSRGGGERRLPPGTKVYERPQIAATQLTPYISASLQQVASAIGVTYEILASEFSNASFSSARLGAINNGERFREIRELLIRDLFEVVYIRWLERFLLTSPFDENYSTNAYDYEHSWSAKEVPYVDPNKATVAARTARDMNVVSLSTAARNLGFDYMAELKQQAADEQAAKDLGITLNQTTTQLQSLPGVSSGVQQPLKQELTDPNKQAPAKDVPPDLPGGENSNS